MVGINPNLNSVKTGSLGGAPKTAAQQGAIKKTGASLGKDGIKKAVNGAQADAIEKEDEAAKKENDSEISKNEESNSVEENKDTAAKEKADLKNALKTKILKGDKNKKNDKKETDPSQKTDQEINKDEAKVKAEKADNEWSSKTGAQKLSDDTKAGTLDKDQDGNVGKGIKANPNRGSDSEAQNGDAKDGDGKSTKADATDPKAKEGEVKEGEGKRTDILKDGDRLKDELAHDKDSIAKRYDGISRPGGRWWWRRWRSCCSTTRSRKWLRQQIRFW